MTYTLFYSPGACSLAVHVLLIEVGAKYELVNAKEQRDALLKYNPRGSVPVLLEDGKVLREGAAILTYLAEKHESPLLPSSGFARGQALEWLAFANSTVHPKYGAIFAALFKRGLSPEETVKTEPYPAILDTMQAVWDEVEAELADKPYLVGKECTLGDILLTVIANWSAMMPRAMNFGPKTKDYLKRVSGRPAYQQAMAEENVEYKVAA